MNASTLAIVACFALLSVTHFLYKRFTVAKWKVLLGLNWRCCNNVQQVATGSPIHSKVICAGDYSPCICTVPVGWDPSQYYISCDGVPSSDIRAAFVRNDAISSSYSYFLTLTLASNERPLIDAGMFGEHRFNSIHINCQNPANRLVINSDAFSLSINSLGWFEIISCDLGQLDFSFLEGFSPISFYQMAIKNSSRIQTIETLPVSLAALSTLTIDYSQGFSALKSFPALPALKYLYLIGNDITDEAAEVVLNSLASSNSSKTIGALHLDGNPLTRIPPNFTRFSNLYLTTFDDNQIEILQAGSLAFTVPSQRTNRYVDLRRNGIRLIEPAAFQGTILNYIPYELKNEQKWC